MSGRAEHTPGPWTFKRDCENACDIRAPGEQYVGNVMSDDPEELNPEIPEDEMVANAALIAAAPDLLAACESVLAADGDEWETGKRVLRAAIEKATGGAR